MTEVFLFSQASKSTPTKNVQCLTTLRCPLSTLVLCVLFNEVPGVILVKGHQLLCLNRSIGPCSSGLVLLSLLSITLGSREAMAIALKELEGITPIKRLTEAIYNKVQKSPLLVGDSSWLFSKKLTVHRNRVVKAG